MHMLKPSDLVHTRVSGQTWSVTWLGGNRYKLTPTENAGGFIIGTGAGDTYALELLKNCNLVAIYATHTTSAKVEDSTAFTWSFERAAGEKLGIRSDFVSYTSTTVARFIETFGGFFPMIPALYQISLNLTATHRLYIEIIVDVN